MRVRELAERLGAPYEGEGEREIDRADPIELAGIGSLAFAASKAAERATHNSEAGCIIVGLDYLNRYQQTVIRVPDPRAAFARAVNVLQPPRQPEPGVHPTAVVGAGVQIAEGVSIGPGAVLEEKCVVGARSSIGAGSVLGAGVRVGRDCRLGPRVTVYAEVELGDRVLIHAGAVLGSDGFGFVRWADHWEKFPQVGRVVIGNDVEIGANSCIDRAALGATEIGDGTKLDNLVHVGHNCKIGRHVVVAAQTGFSGGVVVEDYAVIGGQVGIGDKARIGSRATLGSGCGVLTSKIIRPGQVVWGTPARPLKEYLETLAAQSHVPAMRKDLKALRDSLESLVGRLEDLANRSADR